MTVEALTDNDLIFACKRMQERVNNRKETIASLLKDAEAEVYAPGELRDGAEGYSQYCANQEQGGLADDEAELRELTEDATRRGLI